MKYKFKPVGKMQKDFTPFEMTLTFETKEEYVHFHNKVMHKVHKNLKHADFHDFFGDVYRAGSNGSYNRGEV
jgi:hypothetical protein